MTENIIIAIVGGLLTFVGTVYATRVQHRRNRTEALKTQKEVEDSLWRRVKDELSEAYKRIDILESYLQDRDARITSLVLENAELRVRIQHLEKRLDDTGPLKGIK